MRMGGSNQAASNPPTPRVIRMPTSSDPSVLAAGQRARNNIRGRKGRLSTILSQATRSLTGSGGQLGA